MAINPSQTITYGALRTNVLNWIKTKCNNIDAYSSNVHASMKANWSSNVKSTTTKWARYYAHNINRSPTKADYYQTTCTTKISTVNNSVIPVVSLTQLTSDYDSFMTNANISQRDSYIVTTSGLLNFWNNVICFLYRHLVDVTSNQTSNSILMYQSDSPHPYEYVSKLNDKNSLPNETQITAQDINEIIDTMGDTYNPSWRTHPIQFTTSLTDSTTYVGTGTSSTGAAGFDQNYPCQYDICTSGTVDAGYDPK
jgi:hypothetical protein